MDKAIRAYEEKLNAFRNAKNEVRAILFLDYDIDCLDDHISLSCISKALHGGEAVELEGIYHSYAMEVEMVATIGKSLDMDKRKDLISKIEEIKHMLSEIDECKGTLRVKLRYLHGLLGEDLFFGFVVEVGCVFSLAKAIPSEIMKYGVKTYGSPVLSQHPLVAKTSPRNQEKLLRKLCCKVALAAKLDFCGSSFEIDFYGQMEDIFNSLENVGREESSILKPPLARKTTRRGGIGARRKRRTTSSPRKRKFLKLGADSSG